MHKKATFRRRDFDTRVTSHLLLGIDTGGTYTDAVLFHETDGVLAKAKSLTTRHDLAIGIAGAVDAVIAKAGAAALGDPSGLAVDDACDQRAGGRAGRPGRSRDDRFRPRRPEARRAVGRARLRSGDLPARRPRRARQGTAARSFGAGGSASRACEECVVLRCGRLLRCAQSRSRDPRPRLHSRHLAPARHLQP